MRQTLHLSAEKPEQIIQAAELLRSGRLVAFATETVYGLGANALSTEAVARIFEAKRRPSWDPLIVHIASVAQLAQVAVIPPQLASRLLALAAAFWPGPLTLLLPRKEAIPDAVTAGRDLVGVRIPSHPAALALLREANLPIAAPSANRFGHTSPTTAAHVLADLEGRIDAVLDAGPTSVGVESTVLDPTQTPMVLYRPGAVTAEQIRAATGVEVTVYEPAAVETPPEALPSPGVGIRHYAPRATLVLVEAWVEPPQAGAEAGVMLPEGWQVPAGAVVYAWGRWEDLETLAARMFAGLRELDDRGVEAIVCPLPAAGGLGDALRDRLRKAAMTK